MGLCGLIDGAVQVGPCFGSGERGHLQVSPMRITAYAIRVRCQSARSFDGRKFSLTDAAPSSALKICRLTPHRQGADADEATPMRGLSEIGQPSRIHRSVLAVK